MIPLDLPQNTECAGPTTVPKEGSFVIPRYAPHEGKNATSTSFMEPESIQRFHNFHSVSTGATSFYSIRTPGRVTRHLGQVRRLEVYKTPSASAIISEWKRILAAPSLPRADFGRLDPEHTRRFFR